MRLYIAKEGDTLHSIAEKYRAKAEDIVSLNPHMSHGLNGKIIKIPLSAAKPNVHGVNITLCPPDAPTHPMDDWIPLTPLTQMEQTDYDVIIVGSGAGGGAVLWRLCEQWSGTGRKVGVIEAGDLLLPTNALNIATLDLNRYQNYFLNPKVSKAIGMSLPEFSGAKQVLAVGGRTLFWGTNSPRIPDFETEGWPVSVKEMEFYYNIAEQVMNVTQDYTKGSAITEVLLRRLREGGFPYAESLPMAVDLEATKYGEIHSNVFFSSILFLARALNQHPFDLAVKARAVQVLMEKGKAVGVKVMSPEKRPYFLRSKIVVLAASALETPRILLYSGIQGEAIGRYLVNHSFLSAKGILHRKDFPEVLGTLRILIPYTKGNPYSMQINGPGTYWYYAYKDKPLEKEWEIPFLAFGKVESRRENKVTLDPDRLDEYGVPEIKVNYSYSKKDQDVIARTASALKQVSLAMGIPLIGKDSEPDICLFPPGRDYHESGTCRMGEDPTTSAANRYGQIHGISGLYIADNSLLPSIGATHPTLATVALAIRTADYIVHQWNG